MPCECVLSSAIPLRRSCVSKRSRCSAVRICLERGELSAEIVRVEALSLWRRASLSWSRRTLCADPACGSALAMAPCEFVLNSADSPRRSCVSMVFESCLVVCAPAFAIAASRVRFPPGLRQLRLKNNNSQVPKYGTETVLPQLWLEGNFGVQKYHASSIHKQHAKSIAAQD